MKLIKSLLHVICVATIGFLTSVDAYTYTIGSPIGFGSGATGGAGGREVIPTTNAELKSYLKSSETLIIILDREFNFIGSEGSTTGQVCISHFTEQCPNSSQYVIVQNGDPSNTGGCDGYVSNTPMTWDTASLAPNNLYISSNKTLRGIDQRGKITGKGIIIDGDNIIVQNVFINNLNPKYVWGGDAIYLQGYNGRANKKIWLDHIRVKDVGRQMFVANKYGAEITISNSDFDGRTSYSASCDGRHYWTLYFTGSDSRISFIGNYVHSTSGRAPKVVTSSGSVVAHIANNYFADNSGHSFEVEANSYVLAEGNYFEDTTQPTQINGGNIYGPGSSDTYCQNSIGRACVPNGASNSGTVSSSNGQSVLNTAAQYYLIKNYNPATARQLSKSSSFYGVNGVAPYLDTSSPTPPPTSPPTPPTPPTPPPTSPSTPPPTPQPTSTTTAPTSSPPTVAPPSTTPKPTGIKCNYQGGIYEICRLSNNNWGYENGSVCVGIVRCVQQGSPYGVVVA